MPLMSAEIWPAEAVAALAGVRPGDLHPQP